MANGMEFVMSLSEPPPLELLQRYTREGDGEALATLVRQCQHRVQQTCRRYLDNPADVDDAVQETFARLVHHAAQVQHVPAWLAATARSVAVDILRQRGRERSQLQRLSEVSADPHRVIVGEQLAGEVFAALATLDRVTQRFVLERFLGRRSVRDMARRHGSSAATMSRQSSAALTALRRALAARGLAAVDRAAIEQALRLAEARHGCHAVGGEGDPLRLALAWQGEAGIVAPGLGRPIRIGLLLSHHSTLVPVSNWMPPVESQLLWTPWKGSREYHMIGILEPRTSHLGHMERGLRHFELTDGLIEATDRNAMRRLDVIFLGHSYALSDSVIDAVLDAVEVGGVGIYHQGYAGLYSPSLCDSRVQRLMLAGGPIAIYHTPGQHNLPLPGTVLRSHPVIAGMTAGTAMTLGGCGPVYKPRADAVVLIQKDPLVRPNDTGAGSGPGHLGGQVEQGLMPVLVLGQVGRGRVAVVPQPDVRTILNHPAMQGDFLGRIIRYLAEPHVSAEVEVMADRARRG
jgi:RNA polymerase sigma factor (sigma-70 family)